MRLVDFFFALRPLVLVPAWSFFLVGQGAGGSRDLVGLRWVLLTAVLAGVHLVNQIVDFESDRLNDKGFFLQRGIFSRRLYAGVAAVLVAGGSLGAVAAKAAPVPVLLAAVLGLAYSLPPVRLAARPGLDLAANALGYGLVAPWAGAGSALPLAWPLLVSTSLAVAAVFLHTTLLDLEGDRRTGKRTVGTWIGPRAARRLAALLALAAAASALLGARAEVAAAGVVVALLAVGAVAGRLSSRSVCVAGTATYALAAGWAWPPFVPGVVGLVVATRLYYRRRFALAYPAL